MCSLSIRPLLARDCANEVILACKAAKSRTLIVLVAALLLAILVFLEALGAYLFQPIPVQWGAPAMVGLFIKSGARPRWRHSRRAGGENDQKSPCCCRSRRHRSRRCTESNTADALNKCSFVVLDGAGDFFVRAPTKYLHTAKIRPKFCI
jgi:hypothetical protein